MAVPKKTRKSKGKGAELVGQADPRAALDSAALLAVARPLLQRLEADLIARAQASPAVTGALTARYEAEKAASRTADSFAGWSAALATQVAAAWLLSCVFVRTLEDRGLLKQARLAGPGAEDSQRQFFQLAPSLTERDYLLTVFRELAHHPAAKDLFAAEHSLVWKLSPSAEVAKELLALFRAPTASEPAFRFGQPSTRFLGDLYQDLSEDVRKRYALLQTPDFVETYILDRTLEPAIARFGLDDTTLIDPTCGSGHFLLGAFERLFEHRLRAAARDRSARGRGPGARRRVRRGHQPVRDRDRAVPADAGVPRQGRLRQARRRAGAAAAPGGRGLAAGQPAAPAAGAVAARWDRGERSVARGCVRLRRRARCQGRARPAVRRGGRRTRRTSR